MDDVGSFHVGEAATFSVSSPNSNTDTSAAQSILDCPDAHVTLVLVGDTLSEGVASIHSAIKNPILRKHFLAINAKRILTQDSLSYADVLKAAQQVQEPEVVMSSHEAKKLEEQLRHAKASCAAKMFEDVEAALQNLQNSQKTLAEELRVSR
jgi:hypothetical protein